MKRFFFFMGCCVVCLGTCLFAQSNTAGLSAGIKEVQSNREVLLSGARSYFTELTSGSRHRFDIAMNSVESYIDFFACQDMDSLPAWEQPIFELIRQGQYDDAIARYESQNLLKKYANRKIDYTCLERYIMLLELTCTRHNATLGLEMLQTVAELDSVELRPMISLTNIGMELRQFGVVDEYLNTFQTQPGVSDRDRAAAMGLRAKMLLRRNRPNEALGYARSSIAIYDSLARVKKDPDYEPLYRARTHYTLARVYFRMDDRALCAENVRKTRRFFESAAQDDEMETSIERIRTLYSMAPLAADVRDFFLADTLYTDVDSLGQWLFSTNSSQRSLLQFNSLRLRGLCCFRVGKIDEARSYLDEAAAVLATMDETTPGQLLMHKQDLNFNLATLYYAEGNYEKALETNLKVLSLVEKDNLQDAHRHALAMSSCYKYIGNCLWAMGYAKYLDGNKRKCKTVIKYYQDAADSYATALHFNSRDNEAIAKYNLSDLIVSGMEKPMAMPANF